MVQVIFIIPDHDVHLRLKGFYLRCYFRKEFCKMDKPQMNRSLGFVPSATK